MINKSFYMTNVNSVVDNQNSKKSLQHIDGRRLRGLHCKRNGVESKFCVIRARVHKYISATKEAHERRNYPAPWIVSIYCGVLSVQILRMGQGWRQKQHKCSDIHKFLYFFIAPLMIKLMATNCHNTVVSKTLRFPLHFIRSLISFKFYIK